MIARDPEAAVYRRIAADLRGQILSGARPPGSALGSVARLGHEYGVSLGTVQRALAVLRADGLIETVPGRVAHVLEPEPVETVAVPRGPRALVRARPPTPAERQQHNVPDGVWVLEVRRGGEVHLWLADRTELSIS